MATTKTASPGPELLRSWLAEVNGTKRAAARTEPGSRGGATSHAIKDVDDGTHPVTEGARSRENEKDVAAGIHSHVEKYKPDGPGAQDEQQFNLGDSPRKTAVGEDPSIEDNYKGSIADPGTTHPLKTDMGEKYSAAKLNTAAGLKEAAASVCELGNNILADIAVAAGIAQPAPTAATKKAMQTILPLPGMDPLKRKTEEEEEEEEEENATPAPVPGIADAFKSAEAGYQVAAYLGLNKTAADAAVQEIVAGVIKTAMDDADRVGRALHWSIEQEKKAQGLPPEAMGGIPPEALMAAGGGGMPPGAMGGMPPEAMGGGMPPEAMMGGMPPEAMGGGMPPGAGGAPPGPGGGGEVTHEQALQELAMAMMELGISPEELTAFIQAQGQGGAPQGGAPQGGAPPGEAPAPPPMEGEPKMASTARLFTDGRKIASAVKDFRRSGKFEVRQAKDAAERTRRNEMKAYIREIMAATRGE